MVAEMASCGAACHLEDGDEDVPVLEHKDNLSESDSSSSENTGTSAEDSSEEEEEEKKGEDDSEGSAEGDLKEEDCKKTKSEESKKSTEPEAAALNGRDDRSKLCCEKCKAILQVSSEKSLLSGSDRHTFEVTTVTKICY
ncbi:bromodomain adjacent to zinc finger domain protein 2B [Nematolebias whitei]|uniref:bromodomain adjacent to zinc finger domain protein 2B n=1 Tax=Nematolebias whitei TaxID=451745 RepID=UPI0018985830|nr:bromodomain adjacent to zinc finger domain protein 2B [Nematolebias whitei]